MALQRCPISWGDWEGSGTLAKHAASQLYLGTRSCTPRALRPPGWARGMAGQIAQGCQLGSAPELSVAPRKAEGNPFSAPRAAPAACCPGRAGRRGQPLRVWQPGLAAGSWAGCLASPPRICPRSQAPACPAKCWVMGSRCCRRTASSLDAAETPQPGQAEEGSRTRPCDERFVPPLLSHPQAAGREKHLRLARAQNPSRCCKSALCVCRALQTLGIRAVPSPLWVATVWEIRAEKQPGRKRAGALGKDRPQQHWRTQHRPVAVRAPHVGAAWGERHQTPPCCPAWGQESTWWLQGGNERQSCPVFG